MTHLPMHIPVLFGITALIALYTFYKASGSSRILASALVAWISLLAFPALNGFFTQSNSLPPRIAIAILPPMLATILCFSTTAGRRWVDGFDLKTLTLLHTVRIPVEVVLYLLYLNKMVPLAMTFEGRNIDIVSGISAPLIAYAYFKRKELGPRWLLGWNLFCMAVLTVTVGHGMLSAPSPFQMIGFTQPNLAVLYFPFIFLPALVVPIVYFSHLTAIRQLIQEIILQRKAAVSPMS